MTNEVAEPILMDYRCACPKCHKYQVRLDQPVGKIAPCDNCGQPILSIIWCYRVERPEDEDCGI